MTTKNKRVANEHPTIGRYVSTPSAREENRRRMLDKQDHLVEQPAGPAKRSRKGAELNAGATPGKLPDL